MNDRIVCSLHEIEFVKCSDENSRMITVIAAITGSWPDHPDGGFEITDSDINDMILLHERSGKDILFDYDHRSFNPFNSSSKAAGWGKTLRNDNSKLKIDVELTDEGYNAVINKHYRYLSPVFLILRKKIEGVPRVQLHSVSFTNIPYLEELPPIKNHNTKPDRRLMDMDIKQLSQLLKCSETEEAVTEAIKAMLAKNSELETKVSESDKKLAEADVNMAEAEGKINSSQKDFALTIRNQGKDLFDKYLNSLGNNPKLTEIPGVLPVSNNTAGDPAVKFEDLMDDPQKMETFKNSFPQQFDKLYNDYIGG
jgi:phage I-like protein